MEMDTPQPPSLCFTACARPRDDNVHAWPPSPASSWLASVPYVAVRGVRDRPTPSTALIYLFLVALAARCFEKEKEARDAKRLGGVSLSVRGVRTVSDRCHLRKAHLTQRQGRTYVGPRKGTGRHSFFSFSGVYACFTVAMKTAPAQRRNGHVVVERDLFHADLIFFL